jgi:chemotaxis protein CheZ
MVDTNDSDELEALFDSISYPGGVPAKVVSPPSAPVVVAAKVAAAPVTGAVNDSDDLQDLFDSIANASQPVVSSVAPSVEIAAEDESAWDGQESVYKRIGKMARELHDALHELGYDKLLENAVSAVPDARDRLAYIANITEQAACRVLNATDVAQPIVEKIQADSDGFSRRWEAAFSNQLSVAEFKKLAEDSRDYFKSGLPKLTSDTNAQLLEIMMAQDFQDLTGQVIKKIVGLAESLENGLMKVLVEIMPESCKKSEEVSSLLNGPVITVEGKTDIVVSQQQVDDLLDTLGF